MRSSGVLIGLLLLPTLGATHHSIQGEYLPGRLDVEGEVVKVFWGNPHPRLTISVQNESGEEELMHLEAGGLGTPARTGLPRDILNVGDRIKVAVRKPTRGSRYVFNHLLLPNGTQLIFGNGDPRWPEEYVRASNRPNLLTANESDVAPSEEQANGIFRVWVRSGPEPFREIELPLTDSAVAAQAGFELERDYPILGCVPPGMPRAVVGNPWPMEFIESGNEITMRMEEYDIVRTIQMSPDASYLELPPTPLGHAAGYWENGTLLVRTSRINWPFFDNAGVPQSESISVLERYSLNEDGNELTLEITVDDPETFEQSVTSSTTWRWLPGLTVNPYDCVPDELTAVEQE